jgi:hypothetical protein
LLHELGVAERAAQSVRQIMEPPGYSDPGGQVMIDDV